MQLYRALELLLRILKPVMSTVETAHWGYLRISENVFTSSIVQRAARIRVFGTTKNWISKKFPSPSATKIIDTITNGCLVALRGTYGEYDPPCRPSYPSRIAIKTLLFAKQNSKHKISKTVHMYLNPRVWLPIWIPEIGHMWNKFFCWTAECVQ